MAVPDLDFLASLTRLNERDRELVIDAYVVGASDAALADRDGVSKARIYQRVQRAAFQLERKPRGGLESPSSRRWKPVRLGDVPLNARLAAARALGRERPDEAGDLFYAAVRPSDTVYYVAA